MSVKIINEALITDYISSEELDKLMVAPEFGDFSAYKQLDGMRVQTTKYRGAFPGAKSGGSISRYWKFVKTSDGWKVYETDVNGEKIGNPFSLEPYIKEEGYLNEGNPVSNNLPARVDNFLQDFAQMYGGISYDDIANCTYSKELKKCISDIKVELKGYSGDIYELAEEDEYFKSLCDNLIKIVKTSKDRNKNESLNKDIDTAIYSVAFDIEVPASYTEVDVEDAIKIAIKYESDCEVSGYMEVHKQDY